MKLSLLCLLLLLSIGVVSAAPHGQYPSFSSSEGRFSLSAPSFVINDDIVYRIGHYSINGDDWVSFTLQGNTYPGSSDWLSGSGSYSLPPSLLSGGEHYIIVYSCSRAGNEWDCHPTTSHPEGYWQLHALNHLSAVLFLDFTTPTGGYLEEGASLVQDDDRGAVLSPSNGVFRIPNNPSLAIQETITLSSWVNLHSGASGNILIKPVDGGANPWDVYALDIASGVLRFILSDGTPYPGNGWHAITTTISTGNWHHVAGTYDGITMRLYLDGVQVVAENVSLTIALSEEDLLVGGYLDCCYLDGLVDDVAVYSTPLSPDDITLLYGNTTPATCSGPDQQPCVIPYGNGSQSRTCTNGEWSDWSLCSANSCDNGYRLSGGVCVEKEPTNSGLLAGIAKVDITPPLGQPLGGYGNYGGCTSIHDPINARVLLLQDNNVTIAFVSLDLLMFSSDNVIEQAKQDYGIDHVILSSTHTHAGPIPRAMTTWSNFNVNPEEQFNWATFPNDQWYAETEDKVILAIGEAMSNLFPATISAGKGTLESDYLAHNRRLPGGQMLWANPSRMPTSPLDHTVGVVRIHDDIGETRAMMVNYACHPVHTAPSNSIVTADFPGVMSNYIEEELGPGSIALFINAAAGDIDPYFQGSYGDSAFFYIDAAGRDLAQAALNVSTQTTAGGPIKVQAVVLNMTDRWTPSKTHEAGMTNIIIHDDIAFVTLVGEVFIQHQINLYNKSTLPNTFLYGYSYSGLGGHYLMYMPTIEEAHDGGYGASSVTYLEIGAGERMINEALSFINQ